MATAVMRRGRASGVALVAVVVLATPAYWQ